MRRIIIIIIIIIITYWLIKRLAASVGSRQVDNFSPEQIMNYLNRIILKKKNKNCRKKKRQI